MMRRLLLLLSLLCVSFFSWGGAEYDPNDVPLDSLFANVGKIGWTDSLPDADSPFVKMDDTLSQIMRYLDSVQSSHEADTAVAEITYGSDTLSARDWYRSQYGPGKKMRKYEERKPLFEDFELSLGPLVWLVAGMVIFLVVVVLVVTISGYQRKKKGVNHQQESVTTVELEGGDLKRMVEKENYKEAVRILYVQTLTWLNNRELIRWERSKTPIEYYYEMPDKRSKAPFLELTRIFLEARYDRIVVDRVMFDRAQQCANLIMKR